MSIRKLGDSSGFPWNRKEEVNEPNSVRDQRDLADWRIPRYRLVVSSSNTNEVSYPIYTHFLNPVGEGRPLKTDFTGFLLKFRFTICTCFPLFCRVSFIMF